MSAVDGLRCNHFVELQTLLSHDSLPRRKNAKEDELEKKEPPVLSESALLRHNIAPAILGLLSSSTFLDSSTRVVRDSFGAAKAI
jgi:hypothetical protein